MSKRSATTNLEIRGRALTRVYTWRKSGGVCLLCGKKLKGDEGELHEVVSRRWFSAKHLPVYLHARLCKRCNGNDNDIAADSAEGRQILARKLCGIWGDIMVERSLEFVCSVAQIPMEVIDAIQAGIADAREEYVKVFGKLEATHE